MIDNELPSENAGLHGWLHYTGSTHHLSEIEETEWEEQVDNRKRVGCRKTFIDYCHTVNAFPSSYVYGMVNGFEPDTAPIPQQKSDFNYITPEDVYWAERHKAFSHTLAMPRSLRNFCPMCVDKVIDYTSKPARTTVGVYLPVEHACPRIRLYDLMGKLIEVKQL